jgi:hypothetical protein
MFRHLHPVCSNLGRLFAAKLRQIGQGTWLRDGVSKRLATSEPGLELWRTKVTKGGRIIWQVRIQQPQVHVQLQVDSSCWVLGHLHLHGSLVMAADQDD